MAFYADELSPIDRSRNLLGKASDHPDVGLIKSRRQWKSLVLGKKDLGMNSFATIAEEREEEISSDGSQGGGSPAKEPAAHRPGAANGLVTHRKITFPKPRKYIASRVAARRKGDAREEPPSPPLASPEDLLPAEANKSLGEILSASSFSSKPSLTEVKLTAKKSRESVVQRPNFVDHYALTQPPFDSQWNDAVAGTEFLTGWPKAKEEKALPFGQDFPSRARQEEKKKPATAVATATTTSAGGILKAFAGDSAKEAKAKKAGAPSPKKGSRSPPSLGEAPAGSKAGNLGSGKTKREKGKSLNMKDVVNVYKNLAYGSKDEIKSFVEKLSFVKDESESDKNLVSVMNLKVLENKIKSIAKKTTPKCVDASATADKKGKGGKSSKRSRKAHIDRLARHKVVKVPAASNSRAAEGGGGAREKRPPARNSATTVKDKDKDKDKDKEPWRYVGMQSALDKTYFVYPSYPLHPSTADGGKRAAKKSKAGEKEAKDSGAKKAKPAATATATASGGPRLGSKVNRSEVVLRHNLLIKGRAAQRSRRGMMTRSTNVLNVSASCKSMNRPSATTVCTVQFRQAPGEEGSHAKDSDPGLLLYLHGTKALNVKCPYADKQFSRVKFFRKAGRGMPLIGGLDRTAPPKGRRLGRAPGETLTRVRSVDLLDFDEDIENITEFLRSQNQSPRRKGREEREAVKKSERDWPPRETPRQHRRQRRPPQAPHHHNHQHHQHGTRPLTLTPEAIVAEIAKHVQHLQYLPDTEDNRKTIAAYFRKLDHRLDATRSPDPAHAHAVLPKLLPSQTHPHPHPHPYGSIPILGF